MGFLKSYWVQIPWWSLKQVYRLLILALLGLLIVGGMMFYFYIDSLPALSTWHTVRLKEEFTVHSGVKNIQDYFDLEERLFQELQTEVYDKVTPQEQNSINRYTAGSLADPDRWSPNWNRSFEMPADNPKGAVLLLHGMSDAPYSLHTQAEYLHKAGYWVLGLRMPGHGTVPSGLTGLKWQDMAAVVELGMKHLREKMKHKPLYIIGYSTGATLALNYTFKSLEKDSPLRVPDALVFYSPAIGVSAAAPLAVWQSRIGHLLHLPKLEWNSILPEYDPFKYGSFAVNAGDQVYRLAKRVQEQFYRYQRTKNPKPFPPVLSFSSVVDSTVSIPAVVENLFERLPKGDHRLVLFDINHNFDKNNVVKSSVQHSIASLLQKAKKNDNYTLEFISNRYTGNRSVERIIGDRRVETLALQWPQGLYSLSHLAIPISPLDPLYGSNEAPTSPGIKLGQAAMYGETGVLLVSPALLLRQRWNPFHDYVRQKVLAFLQDS